MTMATEKIKLRRLSSANDFQEKSITKCPDHLKGKSLIKQIHWTNCVIVFGIPLLGIYGLFTTSIKWYTVILSMIYYFITGLGVTAGYHRLWSHLSYKASDGLQLFLMISASGALQGSAKYWSYLHRAHHRWTDTDLDPYNYKRGFWYAHFGWLLTHRDIIPNTVNVTDLKANPMLLWQHNNYYWFGPFMALILPGIITYLLFNDFRSGFYIVGALRCSILFQGTWCVNSVAHSEIFAGKSTYDDTHTPRDSVVTALLTFGEGYHNFHHEFPNDYRNGIRWYHYDPTKWVLNLCYHFNFASDLYIYDYNEIKRGEIDMREKQILIEKQDIDYGVDLDILPIWTVNEYKNTLKSIKRNKENKIYVVFHDIIHDVTNFINDHPGGSNLIKTRNGKDITEAFNGKVYNHSNCARNLLSKMRIAKLSK